MEEVRQLVQEEGREARNLVAYHVTVETPASKLSRKPPRAIPPPPRPPVRTTRLRSASAGRDKRSELRARYWALLFGDLQRAIGEIYNTVQANENLNECQEVILVLENYTRDFKALAEWFRVKWDYDNTPPPQRPQSLAWEIRKTDFVKPEPKRAYSVKSSPTVSGKNSPSFSGYNTPSGKNSPNPTGKVSPGSGKISPRVASGHSSTSPKANIEFFSNKINTSKITAKPEPKIAKELSRLSDIKEKDIKEICEDSKVYEKKDDIDTLKPKVVEIGHAKLSPCASPKLVVIKAPKSLTKKENKVEDMSNYAQSTVDKLNVMENEFLKKQILENKAKNDNMINNGIESDKPINNCDSVEKGCSDLKVKNNSELVIVTADKPAIGDIKSAIENQKTADTTEKERSTETSIIEKQFEGEETNELELLHKQVFIEKNDLILNVPKNSQIFENQGEVTYATCQKDFIVNKNNSDGVVEEEVEKTTSCTYEPEKIFKKDTDMKKSEAKFSKPAYSQAAAKPKATNQSEKTIKAETKQPIKLARSSTVVELRPPTVKTQRPFQKRAQTNKCSYPFNLTTGRTSLFDTVPSTSINRGQIVTKKTSIRTNHMGSGDAKSGNRLNLRTRPRPSSIRLNEKGDKRENVSVFIEKSVENTIAIDMARNESNESIKTLVPEDLQATQDINSSGVNMYSKNDNDGWLTVKSKRESKKQSKSHWTNRFRQPTATASLPTLNMLESPKEENPISIDVKDNCDRAKSEQPRKVEKEKKAEKAIKSSKKSEKRDPTMRRQKSDITGLKTRSSKNKVLTKKAEKAKSVSKEKNRLHSSLESLTMGLTRSEESVHQEFDFDKWKAEFKSTFNFLEEDDHISDHNEILKTADPSEMSEIAEMTSQIEENERKISLALDFQSEVDQRKLCEEEDLLNRQIMELQQVSDIDLDTETDDTETDAEIPLEEPASTPVPMPEGLGSLTASLEDQYETALAGMSWAERVDTLVVLEALVARDPGRAQQLHAKLSQGIKRRGSLQDALRRLQAKQARAERQRMSYQTERAKRIHQLLARVEEVKLAKNQLIEEKKLRMERRLQKAAENRDQHLKDIVRKAHDEEEKLREIAFIKQLEAENRRHEFLDQCKSLTTRLRQMRRDRLTKLEQKAAREAAVGARRQALEAARKLQMETLLEKRKERDARLEEMKEQKKQERDDAAREKAEAVKSRLSALAEAAELEADALRSRIRDKQDASQLRHTSHLQAIREKATGPRQPTTSESHDKDSLDEAEKEELEKKEKDRLKFAKKKARKMKQKLLANGATKTIFDTYSVNPIEKLLTPPSIIKTNKLVCQLNSILQNITNNIHNDNNAEPKKKAKNKNGKNIDDNENNNKNVTTDVKTIEIVNNELNGIIATNNNNDDKFDIPNGPGKNKKKKKKSENVEKLPNGVETNKKKNLNKKEADSESSSSRRKKKKNKDVLTEFDFDLEDDNKKRRKRNRNSEMANLLNDINKCRARKDNIFVDGPGIEKILNELNRSVERLEPDTSENAALHRYLAIKATYELLGLVAEREDIAASISTKCVTVGVTLISRTLSSCPVMGSQLASTNMTVHLITLLEQVDREGMSQSKRTELTRLLADSLSVAFDSVLCMSRIYEDSPKNNDAESLCHFRSRTHQYITYLCLSGCLDRADMSVEARESIQTLLTVCADVSHPSSVDTGNDRATARQALKIALGTGICGSRAEFCVLFAKGASLEQCGGFVRAARTAHLLRALAEMDHSIVQEAFGQGGWPIEFRAAVARLLSQHAPNDKEAPRKTTLRLSSEKLEQSLSETMVLDLIVLVGFVVVNNPQLQEAICEGWSVVKTLCTLPANWLVSRTRSRALLPTLCALADYPACAAAISSELSMTMLEEFLNSPESQNLKLVQVIKLGRAKKHGKK
ncbi:myosin heavy chain, striated muscle [Pieris brassicae]|uniref:myosin heavy chain, striated muscle n=1 Tax=Pieris brassicae TaxID=7116 RepID=UPI001E65E940|nr:myosin heavy chain, striated muscle [Pieris brassicae]